MLDQVRREVTGGCRHAPPCLGLSPCGSKGEVRGGRRKEDQSKCQPRKCPWAPSAVSEEFVFKNKQEKCWQALQDPQDGRKAWLGGGGQAGADGVKGAAHRLLGGVGGCGPRPPGARGLAAPFCPEQAAPRLTAASGCPGLCSLPAAQKVQAGDQRALAGGGPHRPGGRVHHSGDPGCPRERARHRALGRQRQGGRVVPSGRVRAQPRGEHLVGPRACPPAHLPALCKLWRILTEIGLFGGVEIGRASCRERV